MFHRLILTTSLILTATSQAVLAESIDVEFSGTVPEQVTLSTPTINTFTINSNISTSITISTTSTPVPSTLIASTSKNSRLALQSGHPTTTSNNYIAPAGTTNLQAPVQKQSSYLESSNVILLTITP